MADRTKVTTEDVSIETRLRRFLKLFWISLLAAPVLWTIVFIVMFHGSSENLAGVLLILGWFVIFMATLLWSFFLAVYSVVKRKQLPRKSFMFGLLPMIFQAHLLAVLLMFLSADL